MLNMASGDADFVRIALMSQVWSKKFGVNIWNDEGEVSLSEAHAKLALQTNIVCGNFYGKQYKHVIITNGATGALNTVLRVLTSITSDVYYGEPTCSHYRELISRAQGYAIPYSPDEPVEESCVFLIDSPSNPKGEYWQVDALKLAERFFVWDSSFYGEAFGKDRRIPLHDIMIGSYGKFLGLNSCRVGWIATDDDALVEKLRKDVKLESVGVSLPAMTTVSDILNATNLGLLVKQAGATLDANREELSRLKYLLNSEVPENGMFWTGVLDSKARKLIDQAASYRELYSKDGNKVVRLNFGRSSYAIKNFVNTVLRLDRVI